MTEQTIIKYLKSISKDEIAKSTKSFFKTNEGEYSFHDIFLGIKVPDIRKAVKKFETTPLSEIERLLKSKYHEIRLFALLHMVTSFSKSEKDEKENIYKTYLNNIEYVNNWDLVDSSAHYIIGAYLHDRDRKPLYALAQSDSLWERRIAIVSTFYFIKQNQFDDTLKIAKILLNDKEDLIHKSVGWMLREVGKRDEVKERSFLNVYYKNMPRVMLRYAIEKFSQEERKLYLKG
jgi:3-methyladenine DNA glycosylase AlkD